MAKNYKLDSQDKRALATGAGTVGIIFGGCLAVAGIFAYVLLPLYQ